MKKFYLIGLPGSGKSTAGKALASKLNLTFLDLDQYIEETNNKSIPEIFGEYGEDYFRNIETKALEEVSKIDNVIVSCGGGVITKDTNRNLMNGFIVYLNPPLEDVAIRLSRDVKNKRPLMSTNTIEELYNKRKDAYERFSDVIINETILSKVVEKIIMESIKYEKKNTNN